MKRRFAILFFLLFSLALDAHRIPDLVEAEVKARLDSMACLVDVDARGEDVVMSYLNRYLVANRDRSERILGRTLVYFPEIEALLAEQNVPDALKYMAVVESALYPEALSHVGAAGIWQFMKETARSYGLEVNSTVDERYDLTKATLAAIQYMRDKHERFGSWALALAAYNSGGGRVSRAIKRGRSKNFWRIRRYLPRETRNYVPAFIAATYLITYYREHGLQPEEPPLDLQLTAEIKVHQTLSFGRIARLTGLDLETIAFLNPAYRRGYIPSSRRGYPLTLPRRVILAVADYLALQAREEMENTDLLSAGQMGPGSVWNSPGTKDYLEVMHVFGEQDELSQVAKAYGCSPWHLLFWSGLKEAKEVQAGTKLTVYLPAYQLRYNPLLSKPMKRLKTLSPFKFVPKKPHFKAPRAAISPLFQKGRYYCYELPADMSLLHVAHFYGGVTLEQLVAFNQVQPNQVLPKGTIIKVKLKSD